MGRNSFDVRELGKQFALNIIIIVFITSLRVSLGLQSFWQENFKKPKLRAVKFLVSALGAPSPTPCRHNKLKHCYVTDQD